MWVMNQDNGWYSIASLNLTGSPPRPAFQSGPLGPGYSYVTIFMTPGWWPYITPGTGLRGIIQVVKPVNPSQSSIAPSPVSTSSTEPPFPTHSMTQIHGNVTSTIASTFPLPTRRPAPRTSSSSPGLIVGLSCGLGVIAVIVIALVARMYYRAQKRNQQSVTDAAPSDVSINQPANPETQSNTGSLTGATESTA